MINPMWRGRLKIGDVIIPLRRNDPMVWLIHAAMTMRQRGYEFARRTINLIRNR
jgi:hypothetical protein